jgi:hypothetical protein
MGADVGEVAEVDGRDRKDRAPSRHRESSPPVPAAPPSVPGQATPKTGPLRKADHNPHRTERHHADVHYRADTVITYGEAGLRAALSLSGVLSAAQILGVAVLALLTPSNGQRIYDRADHPYLLPSATTPHVAKP